MDENWRKFIDGPLYSDTEAPWREDPAYQLLLRFPGLRDAVGGQTAPALVQAIGLVQAFAQIDLKTLTRQHRPALGLCLGFGMNMFEPYDLLQVFDLDCVHAYEWIGEQVVEAAQALHARAGVDLSARLRLHHGSIGDLGAVTDHSIGVAYVANVFNPEIPMAPETFSRAVRELLRVLAPEAILLSRGSSGAFEEALQAYGHMLLQNPLVSVFQKRHDVATE